jgi:hypothetical protein
MVYPMNENAYRFLLHHGIYRIFRPFNPSIVEDFDQSDLEMEKNESSYRATGGRSYLIHYFLESNLDKNNDLHVMKIGKNIENQRFARRYLIKNVLLLNGRNEF